MCEIHQRENPVPFYFLDLSEIVKSSAIFLIHLISPDAKIANQFDSVTPQWQNSVANLTLYLGNMAEQIFDMQLSYNT